MTGFGHKLTGSRSYYIAEKELIVTMKTLASLFLAMVMLSSFAGNDLMSDTGIYTDIDPGVSKIRIPYGIFAG